MKIMNATKNQAFSKIWIIVILAVLIGSGVLAYQYWWIKIPYITPPLIQDMPIKAAISVIDFNLSIDSEEKALVIFNQNFDKIVKNTKKELIKFENLREAKIIEEMIFFSDHTTVEKREWKNDAYWLPTDSDKLAYVLIVPAVSKYEKWEEKEGKILIEKTECKGLSSGQTIALPVDVTDYEDVKKYLNEHCPEGANTYTAETELKIKYIIDDNGVVYWAGQYLKL